MKTKLTALALAAVAALSLVPKPAFAGDKEWAAVGGFIGGLVVGSVINDGRHDPYSDGYSNVIVSDRSDYRGDRRDAGCWKSVTVRVWVPGCWVVERSRHGHGYRRYIEGHHEFRTNRVWVSNDRHDRYGHHGREVSDGYGHRR